jgi:TRAP-type mannitol/chloroaromatic compound transport system permease large subunit
MFPALFLLIFLGFPVAFSLIGSAFIFGIFTFGDAVFFQFISKIEGIASNFILAAVPLFVFMGVMLERSKIAEELLDTMAHLLGSMKGGLGISVTIVGALLAASTGIVGATVVTKG